MPSETLHLQTAFPAFWHRPMPSLINRKNRPEVIGFYCAARFQSSFSLGSPAAVNRAPVYFFSLL
ncbi:hypothetical protein [Neisseria blantyrii]|uniref:hypothetical protein n=1 Tax=Neisseria blantyrii TaxID=2830647 RepID=UPI00265A11CB|nr:hypothetical protein [Neisseria blantyrii]